MRLGVLSDTHDRTDTTRAALRLLEAEGVGLLLHCGDITLPETVEAFRDAPTCHFVFGNNDKLRDELRQAIAHAGGSLHEPFGHLTLGGIEIGWLHSDDDRLFRSLQEDVFAFLFYGHTHKAWEHRRGSCRVINPGALHRARPKTCGVLDTETGEWRLLEVTDKAS